MWNWTPDAGLYSGDRANAGRKRVGHAFGKKELALAVLDSESEADMVEMQSGTQELKSRLEILLGAKPAAAVDQSEQPAEVKAACWYLELTSNKSTWIS